MADIKEHLTFREIDLPNDDTEIQVSFLGVHVHTIKNASTRPGGHVYVEKEQCIRRAEWAIQRLWAETEGTR